jgi:hypothetical protein
MVITILEGADAVGKSSHAAWLTRTTGGVLLHFGRPDADALDMYVARVARWVQDEHVVLDRSSFGSMVWARLGFHPPTCSGEVMRAVSRWYAEHEARAAVVVRDPFAIAATLDARGEADTIDMVLTAQEEYLRLVASHEVLYTPIALYTSDLLHAERNHA